MLKDYCHLNGLSLHYVTAREAFNIVKAAEQGLTGNPEQYRDYILKKPINRVMRVNKRLKNVLVNRDTVSFELVEPGPSNFSFKIGPIKNVKGWLSSYHMKKGKQGYRVSVLGKGTIDLSSDQDVTFTNKKMNQETTQNGERLYSVDSSMQDLGVSDNE